ncbi:hypothetical protein D3C87_1856310 [compost metagenome]
MTLPGISPRPARPATWVRSWKDRSAARKSGRLREASAAITPTSETRWRSRPLATIWVPMSTSASPAAKTLRMRWWEPLRVVVSRSSRMIRASGKRVAAASATCWVPAPKCLMYGLLQLGQRSGGAA